MDTQTNPGPVESAGAEESAPTESPEPSGSEAETSETIVASGNSPESVVEETSEVEKPQVPGLSDFDAKGWDGNIDNLPAELQDPVRFLHKNLESGYTQKFQTLSDARKKFDADQEKWTAEKDEWGKIKDDVLSERDLLKQLLDGGEDPRIGELTKQHETSSAELARVNADFEEFRRLVEEDIDTQATEFAEKFYQEHREVFDNEESSKILNGLLDQEWEPELAVKLLHQSEDALKLANELREKGTPQGVAVEHALLKHGAAKKRTPRPGAKITAGAESANNPASVQGNTDFGTTAADARMAAAQAAMNWRKRSELK